MKNIIGNIKRFIKPISYSKGRRYGLFSGELFDAFQSVFTVQVGIFIIDAIERKDKDSIIFRGIMLISTFLLSYIFARIKEMCRESASNNLYFGLRKHFFGQYIHLDNTKVETIGTGKMQSIIFDGIGNRVGLITETFLAIIVEIGAIIYAFILIAQKSPNRKYSLGFFGLFLLSSLLLWIGLGVLQKTRKQGKEIHLELVRRDVKILMSKFEILQNNKLGLELDKQEILMKKQIKIWQRGNTIKMFWQVGANIILDGMQVVIYIVVGIGVMTGNYSFAYMMLLLQLLNIISKYVWNIRKYLKEGYKAIVHIEKLRDTFDSIPSMKNDSHNAVFIAKSGDFKCKDISFSYNKSPVFKNFNLDIKGGTKTAFVGESGGGKTTLIKLLAGYIRPDQGTILVDGQYLAGDSNHQSRYTDAINRVSPISLQSYYRHIGYLTQDPSVFDGTIYENLAYALDTQPDPKELEEVINQAKCEFIRDFEKGLETEIGERGVRLSGGQKQRLAIAKIMLKNPSIIFLDEPTSALDSFNEELINIALHNLFKGKTVIVVAHRLQTVKQADRILLFEQGEILEDGTHEELVKLNGKYKKMLDLQSGF